MSRADDLLRPFAAMGGDWAMSAYHDLEDDVVVWENSGRVVTAGDVRAARRYLDGPAEPERTDLRAALEEMEDWKAGRRSWTNLGPNPPYTPDVIAAMDAQEVVKLSAYIQALAAPTPAARSAPDGLREALTSALDQLPEGYRLGILPFRADDGARLYRIVALDPDHGQPRAWADGKTVEAALAALASQDRDTSESGT